MYIIKRKTRREVVIGINHIYQMFVHVPLITTSTNYTDGIFGGTKKRQKQ